MTYGEFQVHLKKGNVWIKAGNIGFIYGVVHKSGCTSMRHVIFQLISGKSVLNKESMVRGYRMLTRRQVMESKLFSFTFVRDPMVRVVSAWRERAYGKNFRLYNRNNSRMLSKTVNFNQFVWWIVSVTNQVVNEHVRTQTFVTHTRGEQMLDFIGKLENIYEDWAVIRERLAGTCELPEVIPHARKTPSRIPYPEIDYETAELIFKRYCRDYELLGYKKVVPERLRNAKS